MSKKFVLIGVVFFCVSMLSFCAFAAGTVTVMSFEGDVTIMPPRAAKAVVCSEGLIIKKGTHISTGRGSYVEIGFDQKKLNVARIKENTEVVVTLKGKDKIELIDGAVFTLLKDMKKGERFRIKTPSAACGARGTGWETMSEREMTRVEVVEDKVFVRGINKDGSLMDKEFVVNKGFERVIEKFEKPGAMERLSEDRIVEMQSEKKEIEMPFSERVKIKKEQASASADANKAKEEIKITESMKKPQEHQKSGFEEEQKNLEKTETQQKDQMEHDAEHEKETKERETKERDMKERDMKERETKERDMKERDMKERDMKERDMKERDMMERDMMENDKMDRMMIERDFMDRDRREDMRDDKIDSTREAKTDDHIDENQPPSDGDNTYP